MKKILRKCSFKTGVFAVLFVSLFSVFQSCTKDDDAPVYPPKFDKAEAVSATEVKFTFDKAIDKATGEMTSTYRFEPSVDISKAVVNGKEITLTLAKPLNGGQYKVRFDNLKSSDGGVFPNGQEVVVDYTSVWKKQTNLYVPFANDDPSTWTFFNLRENKTVKPEDPNTSTEWDIAFLLEGKKMIIYANAQCGGLPGKSRIGVENKPIEEVTTISDEAHTATCFAIYSEMRADADEAPRFGHAWCEKDAEDIFDYSVQNNPLIPFRIPKGRTIVFQTEDGKFGKLEMQSLYKETPPNPLPDNYDQYYLTFRYVIQENGNNLDIPIDVE